MNAAAAAARLAAGALFAAGAAAQVPVHVALPAPLAEHAVRALEEVLGAAARVRAAGPPAAAPGPALEPGVLVGAHELVLWRLGGAGALAPVAELGADLPPGQREPAGRWALPWTLAWSVVWDPAATGGPSSWAELALLPVHDRLGLCVPEVDPGPWLEAMAESLRGGRPEQACYALWTALDARVGAYAGDPREVADGLASGRLCAGVLPAPAWQPLRDRTPAGRELLRADLSRGLPEQRLGVAVLADAGPGAAELARRVLEPELRLAFARAVGLGTASAAAAGAIDLRAADRRLRHFAQEIRGRGRGVEQVADVLDLVFLLLFMGIVLVFWWRRRRVAGAP